MDGTLFGTAVSGPSLLARLGNSTMLRQKGEAPLAVRADAKNADAPEDGGSSSNFTAFLCERKQDLPSHPTRRSQLSEVPLPLDICLHTYKWHLPCLYLNDTWPFFLLFVSYMTTAQIWRENDAEPRRSSRREDQCIRWSLAGERLPQ